MSGKLAWVGRFVVAAVALVIYQPALRIQHYGSWWYLEWVTKLPLRDYIIQFLDPGRVTQGYRPMQGLMVLLEYTLFRVNADGYHLAQIGMHIVTCLLLLDIVWRLSRNARLAFLAALIYASIPAQHLAVFYAPGVVDPWAGIFYLGTIWFWVLYLQSDRLLYYGLTYATFVLALFSKELSIFLPGILFLIEWWLVRKPVSMGRILRQYPAFVLPMIPFVLLELNVQSHGEFTGQFGYKLGPQIVTNLLPYLAVMTFPWYLDNFVAPSDTSLYVWMMVAGLVLALVALKRKSRVLPFLLFFAVLNIAPLLGFPREWFQARYLYVSFMGIAVLLALLVEDVWTTLHRRGLTLSWHMLAPAVALLAVLGGQGISVKAAELAEYTRQVRVPFRDISRMHPTFPQDTYLYFIYPSFSSVWDLEGLFFVRYGTGIKVDGTDEMHPSELHSHQAAYVYYFDSTGRPIEVPVQHDAAPASSPALPARYELPITLERYEVSSTTVPRGQALVLTLQWTTSAPIPQDYVLFAHLVDRDGKIISQVDGPPHRGKAPTSTWEPYRPVVDALVFPIDPDVRAGDDYRLELGMYDLASMRRLALVDASGQPSGDTVVIGPFSIR